jgi:transcriptional regulator with XRE-family HTH domain
MKLQEEYNSIVNYLQIHVKEGNKKLSKEKIAKRLNLSRGHFSALLNGNEEIKRFHLDQIRAEFKDELSGSANNTDEAVVQAATIKMLYNEVAKLKSKVTGQSYEDCLNDMEQSTISIVKDILKAKRF